MQGGEGDFVDVPNFNIPLEDLGVDQVGQVVGGATHQKSMPTHYTWYRVLKGHDIPLVLNLKEHIWVLHRQ